MIEELKYRHRSLSNKSHSSLRLKNPSPLRRNLSP